MAFCEGCGTRLAGGARFCTVCGRKVPAPPAATHDADTSGSAGSCARCGARLPEAARFCKACGKPVVGQDRRAMMAPPAAGAGLGTAPMQDVVGSALPALFDGEEEPYLFEGELPAPEAIDEAIGVAEDAIRASMKEIVELNVAAPSESGEAIVASWLG